MVGAHCCSLQQPQPRTSWIPRSCCSPLAPEPGSSPNLTKPRVFCGASQLSTNTQWPLPALSPNAQYPQQWVLGPPDGNGALPEPARLAESLAALPALLGGTLASFVQIAGSKIAAKLLGVFAAELGLAAPQAPRHTVRWPVTDSVMHLLKRSAP